MDQEKIRETALELQRFLDEYAPIDRNAALLASAMKGCIREALAGQIRTPLSYKDVPSGRMFTDTDLSKYSDLESAYARFKIEITGGEPPALQKLRIRMAAKKQL